MKYNKSLIIKIFLSFLLVFNCAIPQEEKKEDNKTIAITSLGWYIENIDSSYWTSSPTSHCFYDFFIHYSGDISMSDISYARVYNSYGTYWTIPINSTYFNSGTKTIGGWYRFYFSTDNVLPINILRAEIKLTNGNSSSFTKIIPAPGLSTPNSKNFVYTEDSSYSSSDYTPMLKRAISLTGTKSTSISINFQINDSNVYNGFVWFYDSSDNYIGISKTFRNTTNGNIDTIINTGNSINNNGTINSLSLNDSDITYQSGFTFSSISKYIVILTDGAQYASQGKYSSYDCRSISAKTSF